MKQRKIKSEKAITLIALVITIIILLILAGVAIASLTGSGLFTSAQTARKVTRYTNAKEEVDLKLMAIQTECISEGKVYDINEIAKGMKEDEKIAIEKYYQGPVAKDYTMESGIPLFIKGIVVSVEKYDEYKFLIGETCKIEKAMEGEVSEGTEIDDKFTPIEEFETVTIGKISESTKDKPEKNHSDVIINTSNQVSSDNSKSTIVIEIKTELEIKQVTLNGESLDLPEKEDGKYVLEEDVEENGIYNISVIDINDKNYEKNEKVNEIEDDLQIYNIDDLVAFRNVVNSGKVFSDKTVTLEADIDMRTVCGRSVDTNRDGIGDTEISWCPIGGIDNENLSMFDGTFDGKGHTIKNLYINNSGDSGLFSFITGTITRVNLKDCFVNCISTGTAGIVDGNTATAGGIVAGNEGGTITQCSVTGNSTISLDYGENDEVHAVNIYCGGIAGDLYSRRKNF